MALRIVLPLVFAALALSACATHPAPGASSDVAASPSPQADADVRGSALAARFQRVVVAPLNVAVRAPAELEGKGEPIWQELLRYFQERDRNLAVLGGISAERLWLQATADLDLSDRKAALRSGYSRFAQELAQHRDYDLLVVPSLVLRPGYLSGWHASWDGVQREVPNAAALVTTDLSDVGTPGTFRTRGLRGKVAAVSLHVSLLRPDGTELYQGLGGIDVLQEAHRDAGWESELRFVARAQPFSDAEAVREGVERAFDGPSRA
ncbi:MAG: hypothetical protein ACR2P8_04330, partial [Myxococcota bacterium]